MTTPFRSDIEVTGLHKSFGDNTVLDAVDLHVPQGSVFALLGPNGAGKTTTVHILSTLLPADGGEVRVAGHDVAREPDAVRNAIGVTGQFSAVDNLLAGEENLLLMADLHHLDRDEGRRRADELLERFDLVDVAESTPVTYSGGMRRKLDLAMTLIGDPKSSSWTSPPPVWTPPHAARCGRASVISSPTASRSSSPPSTSRGRRACRPNRAARSREAGCRGHRGRAQASDPGRAHTAAVRRAHRARRGGPHRRRLHPRRRRTRTAGAQRR
jgi:ABC-type transport system involved in cytochrome c biogenesis ATPase subunit